MRFKPAASFAVLIFLALTAVRVTPSYSWQSDPIFEPAYLSGVDTIFVESGYGSFTRQLPWPKEINRPNVFLRTVKDIFAKQPSLGVVSTLSPEDSRRSPVLTMSFKISTRSASIDGKSIDIGALSLQIWRGSNEMSDLLSSPIPVVSYPFIISENAEEMQKILEKAIHHLADHLPGYYACGNKVKDSCTYEALKLHYDGADPSLIKTPPLRRAKE